jgi:ribosome-associated protein
MTPPSRPVPLALARLCQHALEEKKAGDVRVLDVAALSSITDYLVIATATSDPHLRALRVELEKVLDGSHSPIVGMETALESGWTVIDAFDVMIHLFTAPQRELYGLERLWKDAVEVGPPQAAKASRAARGAKGRKSAKAVKVPKAAPQPPRAAKAAPAKAVRPKPPSRKRPSV